MSGGIDGTTIYNNANIEGTTFTDTSQDLADITQRITDITYDAGTDTTNIANNVNITKTLTIPSFLNVSTTLTDINQRITDITYNSGTDKTTIANNVDISGNFSIPNGYFQMNSTFDSRFKINVNVASAFGNRVSSFPSTIRAFNIIDTNALIKICRYDNNQAGLELQTVNVATNTLTSSVLVLGGSAVGDEFRILMRTGSDTIPFNCTRTLINAFVPISMTVNNLTQTTGIISQTGTAERNLLKETSFSGDLLILDKRTPTPTPYRFTVGTDQHLRLKYQPTTVEFDIFDVSLNAVGGSTPWLFLPRQTFITNALNISDTIKINFGDNGSYMDYTNSTNTLLIGSGLSNSIMRLRVHDVAGNPLDIAYSPTQLTVPVPISTTTNNITQTTGIITQTTGGVNTLKETTFTGTDPIYMIPNAVGINVKSAIFLTDNVNSGRGGFINQVASGSTFNFISSGINMGAFGNRVQAQAGGVIRFDTRDDGTLTGTPIISMRLNKRGTADTQRLAFAIFEAERTINYFDTEFRLKTLFRDVNAPNTNSTEISKIGASLTIAGVDASSILTVSNRNASNVASDTFVNSTATTDITSTNINLNGAVSTGTNNITQTLTGVISQTGTGTNTVKATNFTGDVGSTGSITLTGALSTFNQTNFTSNPNNDFTKTTISTNYATPVIANTLRVRDIGVVGKSFSFNPNSAVNNFNPFTEAGDSVLYAGTASNQGSVLTLTTWSSTEAGIRIGNHSVNIAFGDTTTQLTAYRDDDVNECEIHSVVNATANPILSATFNLGNFPTATVVGTGANAYHFLAIKLVKGQAYRGVGLYIGTASTNGWEVALYGRGLAPARIAVSALSNSVANTMNYINFTGGPITYTGNSGIGYIGFRCVVASQTQLYMPANTFLNYNNNTMTNGTLNKRAQIALAGSVSFPNPLGSGLAMTNLLSLPYAVLY